MLLLPMGRLDWAPREDGCRLEVMALDVTPALLKSRLARWLQER